MKLLENIGIIVTLTTLFTFYSCCHDKRRDVKSELLMNYDDNDTLQYINNDSSITKYIFRKCEREERGLSEECGSSNIIEQIITESINIINSSPTGQECMVNLNYCQEMNLGIVLSGKSTYYTFVCRGRHFNLAEITPNLTDTISSHVYHDVYVLSDTAYTIYFNYKYGIIRYELPNGNISTLVNE
jgi:hypothetical protein